MNDKVGWDLGYQNTPLLNSTQSNPFVSLLECCNVGLLDIVRFTIHVV